MIDAAAEADGGRCGGGVGSGGGGGGGDVGGGGCGGGDVGGGGGGGGGAGGQAGGSGPRAPTVQAAVLESGQVLVEVVHADGTAQRIVVDKPEVW